MMTLKMRPLRRKKKLPVLRIIPRYGSHPLWNPEPTVPKPAPPRPPVLATTPDTGKSHHLATTDPHQTITDTRTTTHTKSALPQTATLTQSGQTTT